MQNEFIEAPHPDITIAHLQKRISKLFLHRYWLIRGWTKKLQPRPSVHQRVQLVDGGSTAFPPRRLNASKAAANAAATFAKMVNNILHLSTGALGATAQPRTRSSQTRSR